MILAEQPRIRNVRGNGDVIFLQVFRRKQRQMRVVSTNYYVNSDWLFAVPSDAASWEGLTRRKNLIALCEAEKGKIDAQAMMKIIETPLEAGGAQNELTVYQIVIVPETKMLWLRVIGGADWTPIDLAGFLQ